MEDCVFCKIRDREVAKEFDYEDDEIMVFKDINPFKPVHLLVVPKKHIEDYLDFNDQGLLVKAKKIVDQTIKEQKLNNQGYRVSVNGGGAQAINHLHFHVMGPIGKTER